MNDNINECRAICKQDGNDPSEEKQREIVRYYTQHLKSNREEPEVAANRIVKEALRVTFSKHRMKDDA